ncbi:DUF4124 domain-containing protein [Pleionea sp. CnH1-48]|uniref:DUF4124 domain-containing protein n=1 Tax=Pleionea sp. CnH1-48 TaxID=2954494 RepID=UPI0020975509|nr:DUF4124 domain-containing protein [Pleionea sp. CnH1-48]MCO7225223.1 DUF4124 domain-containing protein [Pleionea sp. CnH1-48]
MNKLMITLSVSILVSSPVYLPPLYAAEIKEAEEEKAPKKKKIYRWVDKSGNVHYSDKPQKGAEEQDIKEIPVVKQQEYILDEKILNRFRENMEKEKNKDKTNKGKEPLYKSIKFVEPTQEGIVRSNDGNMFATISVAPKLKDGHRVRLYLDGQPTNIQTELTFALSDVQRGPHTLKAEIVDADNKKVQSSKLLNFFVHKASANRNNN